MKTIITKGGQYFEIWESRKEALKDVIENIMWLDDTEYWDGDTTLYIGYKDGTCFYVDDCGNREGKFKKTGITSDIQLNELEIGTDDGKIHIHASIDAELSNEELFKLLGSL